MLFVEPQIVRKTRPRSRQAKNSLALTWVQPPIKPFAAEKRKCFRLAVIAFMRRTPHQTDARRGAFAFAILYALGARA